MSVLIVGSTGIDDVETPFGKRKNLLGGSAFYAATASSFYSPSSLLGIVGEDFPKRHIAFLKSRKIDLQGLEIVPGGKTFRWSGKYHKDMNSRDTLKLELNTFLQFAPRLSDAEKNKKYVFLANIDPDLHLSVLRQMNRPAFVLADTMDHWIQDKLPSLKKLMRKVDAFVLNDGEARQLTGENNLVRAIKGIRKMGPKIVLLKKGEHGAMLWDGKNLSLSPAFPLEKVVDPTGAGDTFAGAFIGFLARQKKANAKTLGEAVLHGSVVASFNCESFSIEKLRKIRLAQIQSRRRDLKRMAAL